MLWAQLYFFQRDEKAKISWFQYDKSFFFKVYQFFATCCCSLCSDTKIVRGCLNLIVIEWFDLYLLIFLRFYNVIIR